MGNAMENIENMKEEVEHKASHAFSTVMKGLSAAASVGALLRYARPYQYAGAVHALRWLGLTRRRSVWGTLGLLGAGAVAGAAVAMFASPMSGRDTRRGILRGFRNLGQKGREIVETAGQQLGEITEGGTSAKEREGGKEGSRKGEQKGSEKQGEGAGRPTGAIASENRAGSMGIGSPQNVGRG